MRVSQKLVTGLCLTDQLIIFIHKFVLMGSIKISVLDLPVKYLEIDKKKDVARMLNGKDNYGKQVFTPILI